MRINSKLVVVRGEGSCNRTALNALAQASKGDHIIRKAIVKLTDTKRRSEIHGVVNALAGSLKQIIIEK